MAQNTLFNYIKLQLFDLRATFKPQGINITEDKNLQGNMGYHFDLPSEPIILHDEAHQYRLTSHHISVYQREKTDTPNLSQYYYRAHFVDEQKDHYRLDGYFNAQNSLTRQPVFSIKNRTSYRFEKIEGDTLSEQFIRLANSVVSPIIEQLQKRLSDKISALESRYQQLEKYAYQLSANLDTQPTPYMKALSKVQTALDALIPLVPHSHYESVKHFMGQMKSNIEKLYAAPKAIPKRSFDAQALASINRQSIFTKSKNTSKPNPLMLNLDNDLNELTLAMSQLSTLSYAEQIKGIAAIYSRVYPLKFEAPPLNTLKELKKLHSAVHLVGANPSY